MDLKQSRELSKLETIGPLIYDQPYNDCFQDYEDADLPFDCLSQMLGER